MFEPHDRAYARSPPLITSGVSDSCWNHEYGPWFQHKSYMRCWPVQNCFSPSRDHFWWNGLGLKDDLFLSWVEWTVLVGKVNSTDFPPGPTKTGCRSWSCWVLCLLICGNVSAKRVTPPKHVWVDNWSQLHCLRWLTHRGHDRWLLVTIDFHSLMGLVAFDLLYSVEESRHYDNVCAASFLCQFHHCELGLQQLQWAFKFSEEPSTLPANLQVFISINQPSRPLR